MAMLAFVLAAILDPVQAALVLALVLVYRGPYAAAVAGVTAAVASETVMVLAAYDYAWGELLLPRLAASLMQAALLVWLVRLARQLLGGTAAGGAAAQADAGGLPGGTATLLESIGEPARRWAPWHIRAYVKRRLERLRLR
jgi:hypothetical protein